MQKIIMLLTAWFFTIIPSHAQSGSSYSAAMPNIIPPAPTSRVMQKFLGYPVSHATGSIDITIPLYTLVTGMLSLPFELKYHSSGVRAQDPAGIVGRNWSLFPGFKISRTIMGKPDEVYPVADKGNNPSIPDQIAMASPYKSDDCRDELGNLYTRMDGQYDIFQIHMPGIGASFILKQESGVEVVETLTDRPLVITPKLDTAVNYQPFRLYGFEIKDDKGIRYLFGEDSPLRGTPSYVEQTAGTVYNCGWMLREVILPGGEKITFNYQKVTETVPAFSESLIILDNGRPYLGDACKYDWMINDDIGSDSPWWRILGNEGYTYTNSSGPVMPYSNYSLVPSAVIWANGTASFTYASNMLSSMLVKNNSGTMVKSVGLTYSDLSSKLLKKVTLSGEGDYQFVYKDEANTSIANAGIDWWGYYNGTPVTNRNYFPRMNMAVTASRGSISYPMNITIGGSANREPASSRMDYRSLTEITYPTGGKLNITYEPHTYTINGIQKIGGGLRIKSLNYYDIISGNTITRNYQYADAQFTPRLYPDSRSLVTIRQLCTLDMGSCMVRQRVVSIFPAHEHIKANSTQVWYGKVTETNNEGKTEYIYDYKPDEYNNVNAVDVDASAAIEYQLSRLNRYVYSAPWLLSETHYRRNGNVYAKIQQTVNTYSHRVSNKPATIALPYLLPYNGSSNCRFMDEVFGCSNTTRYYQVFGSPIRHNRYNISTGWHNLASTTRTTYDGDSIVEHTTYAYDSARPYNLSQKKTLLSDGNELTEKYYYSNNAIPNRSVLTSSQQSAISNLTTQNRLTTVVQQSLEKNGIQLHSILNGFYNNTLCLPENVYYQKSNGMFENRLYYQYDKYGNPIHAIKDGMENIVYLWSYKGAYPVAEIKNASYDEVKNALNGTLPESLSELASPNMTTINGLRGRLTDALVSTYVYKPLVGIESVTDSRGITTHYEYDSFGRLQESYYKEGTAKRILENYEYQYKNQ